jgi:hypothetical protein
MDKIIDKNTHWLKNGNLSKMSNNVGLAGIKKSFRVKKVLFNSRRPDLCNKIQLSPTAQICKKTFFLPKPF